MYRSELWQLVAPTVGSIVIAVTLNASLTSIANAQNYYNVHQSSPVEAQHAASGTGATASDAVTTINDGARVTGNLTTSAASGVTSDSGQQSRSIASGALGTDASDDELVLTAASTTLQWTGLGALDTWIVGLASLRPPSTFDPSLFAGLFGSQPAIVFRVREVVGY